MKKRFFALILVILSVFMLASCTVIPTTHEVHGFLKDDDYIVTPIIEITRAELEELYGISTSAEPMYYFEAIDENSERVVFIEFETAEDAKMFIEMARNSLRDTFKVFAGNGTRTIMATSPNAYDDAIGE